MAQSVATIHCNTEKENNPIFREERLQNSAQDYTPTPQDHSLNTYGITPHAAVIQHISTPEDGHINVRDM